jgi:hypothetical protein
MAFITSPLLGAALNSANPVVSASTPEYPGSNIAVGTKGFGSDGSEWVLVKLAGTVAAGDWLYISDYTTWTATSLANAAKALLGMGVGCAGAAGTAGQFIWLQRAGYAAATNVTTAATANTAMHTSATAGRIGTASTGGTTAAIAGVVITAAAAANVGKAVLNFPTIGAAD